MFGIRIQIGKLQDNLEIISHMSDALMSPKFWQQVDVVLIKNRFVVRLRRNMIQWGHRVCAYTGRNCRLNLQNEQIAGQV